MNRWVLRARLSERAALRYTPAGLPALDLQLSHEGQVSQDGQARKVSLEVRSVVIGDKVDAINRLPLGSEATFAGFLAPARNGRGLVFHITDWQSDSL
jgi:primosomal replication protein N